MSNIDYIKNVIIYADTANETFTYKAHNFPNNNSPDEVVIRQAIFTPLAPADGDMYLLWSDLCNDNIASLVVSGGSAITNPSTTIKLNKPISGNLYFKLYSLTNTAEIDSSDPGVVILNLDFIRYKK